MQRMFQSLLLNWHHINQNEENTVYTRVKWLKCASVLHTDCMVITSKPDVSIASCCDGSEVA